MTHVLAAALLCLATVGWFLLALLPALREHYGRRDIQPLRLSAEAADIRFFAHSFRRYVDRHIEKLREDSRGRDGLTELGADTAWYAGPGTDVATVFAGTDGASTTDQLVVIAERGVRVPDNVAVMRELYTRGSLAGGAGAVFRALLIDGDATLGPGTQIIRWVDAAGSLRFGKRSTLWGRASSSGPMSLGDSTRFERLAAPRIVFGGDGDANPEPGEPHAGEAKADAEPRVLEPPYGATVSEGRWLLEGDFRVPENSVVPSDLVLTGWLTVGRGAKIDGAVRANVITAGDDCTFSRSIVAEQRLAVGARCRITGPVAVEGEAAFSADCRIGDTGDETTVSAISIRMGRGVVLCGEVWARSSGFVGVGSPPPEVARKQPPVTRRPSLRG